MTEKTDQKSETIAFSGKIAEVVHIELPDGRVFEQYRRPPGVRLIIISPDNRVLITKEHRNEADGGIDLRLPGGKVRDTLEAWHELVSSGQSIVEAAKEVAVKEGLQETGLVVHDPEFITKANAGATVEWDLYYFLVHSYDEHPDGQKLELGENIEVTWVKIVEIREAVAAGLMQEWRSVGVLLGKILPELEAAT